MQQSVIIAVLLAFMALAFHLGRKRALVVAGGSDKIRRLHSRPGYYSFYAAIWAGLPALFLFALWIAFQSSIVTNLVVSELPPEVQALNPAKLNLVVNDIRNLAKGNIVSRTVVPQMQAAADRYNLETAVGRSAECVIFFAWQGTTTSNSPLLRGVVTQPGGK